MIIKRWKYFSEDELRCKGTGEIKMNEEFMTKLIELREKLNQPMVITSGYRSPEHNKRIGGSSKSAHICGLAVDVGCSGAKAHEIVKLAMELGFQGLDSETLETILAGREMTGKRQEGVKSRQEIILERARKKRKLK